jgi:hypothetical protein
MAFLGYYRLSNTSPFASQIQQLIDIRDNDLPSSSIHRIYRIEECHPLW